MPSGLADIPRDALRVLLRYVSHHRTLCYLQSLHSVFCDICEEDEAWEPHCARELGAADVERQRRRLLAHDGDELWQGWKKLFAVHARRRQAAMVVAFINSSRESSQGGAVWAGAHGPGCAEMRERLRDVIELDFSATCLGAGGAAYLADALRGNSRVEQLKLPNQLMKEAGVRSLAPALLGLPTLNALNLEGNRLGPRGAAVLRDTLRDPACRLRSLNLKDNCLGAEGVGHIAAGLHAASPLVWLRLDRNAAGDAGAAAIAAACSGSRQGPVRSLSLRDNGIGGKGVRELCKLLGDAPAGFSLLDLSSDFARALKEHQNVVNRTRQKHCAALRAALPPPPPPPPPGRGALAPAPAPAITVLLTELPDKGCCCM